MLETGNLPVSDSSPVSDSAPVIDESMESMLLVKALEEPQFALMFVTC
jgi:hypothetical protein